MPPVFTIGHSTRSLDEFTALLKESAVETLVDIRRFPMSRHNPQFNETTLPAALAAAGLGWARIGALGGRRGRTPGTPAEWNGFWENDSFHFYADYALTDAFQAGLAELLDMAAAHRVAIMCSETVWWRCHRRIVTDYLLARGRPVFHILGEGHVEPAKMTAGAKNAAGGRLHYPASAGFQPELFPA